MSKLDLLSHGLRARFWLACALGLVTDVLVLVPLAKLNATEHPESAGALIAVVFGAVAGPFAGLVTAVSGGLIFSLAAGHEETTAGALLSSAIWVVTAVISGVSADALRRSRAAQQDLAVALAAEEAIRGVHEESVRLSETLTAALQPRLPARHQDLDVLTVYKPGERLLKLGGDFLDAIVLPDGRLALIIGDVAGHGPLAAALGASLRASWRSLTLAGSAPAQLMATLEAMVLMEDSEDLFVTVCVAWLEPESSRLSVITAGHPGPLVLSAAVEPLDVPAHVPLGVGEGVDHWEPMHFDLPHDCSLLFYTDGLIEGHVRPGSRERLGEMRLAEMLGGLTGRLTPQSLHRLIERIEEMNGSPLPDDVTALALARRSSSR